MSELSNSLADLAERVREANEASAAAERMTAEKALEAGRLLCQAKEQCAHGDWTPFLARAGVHERQARRLMQLARSGLNSGHVSDLGGIKAALAFLSKWRLPTFDETMVIRDPERPDGESPVGRGAAFIWESEHHRGYYDAGIITGGDEELIHTKRPMLPMAGGQRPVNIIIHFLSQHLGLPIDQWEVVFIPREPKMTLVLAPFWGDNTLREPEAA